MAVNLSPVFGVAGQVFDNNGNPLSGGKIYTYAAGTTTPQATYTTAAGSIAHTNPIILDSAGRVPSGEIWLTDGLAYKFVVKDSNEVLIGTYDNVIGINSNFVNFTNQQEIQTATAGQTVFTLATMQYAPATNSLSVFVDGVNQYGPGAMYAYVETDSTTVTFTTGLHVGAEVKFTTSNLNSSAGGDASNISYLPPFVGSVATNVETKLAETISVKDFGAAGDGVADDTAKIQAAIDAATGVGKNLYIPKGTYKLTAQLQVTCGIVGDGSSQTLLQGTNLGVASGLLLNITNGNLFEGFTADGACSADPVSWNSGNFDSFTGWRPFFMSGVNSSVVRDVIGQNSALGAAIRIELCQDIVVENCQAIRGRGGSGDGFYTRRSRRINFVNCRAYDVTRIGYVCEGVAGGAIEICEQVTYTNCYAEYAHDQSVDYSGTEFNSGFWFENSTLNTCIDCATKNTGSRGFTYAGTALVGTAGFPVSQARYINCHVNTAANGFLLGSLTTTVPGVITVDNCSTQTCGDDYILERSKVFLSNCSTRKDGGTSGAKVIYAGIDAEVFVNNFYEHWTNQPAGVTDVNTDAGSVSKFSTNHPKKIVIDSYTTYNGAAFSLKLRANTSVTDIDIRNSRFVSVVARFGSLNVSDCVIDSASIYPSTQVVISSTKILGQLYIEDLTTGILKRIDSCEFSRSNEATYLLLMTSLNSTPKPLIFVSNCNLNGNLETGENFIRISSSSGTASSPRAHDIYMDGCTLYNTGSTTANVGIELVRADVSSRAYVTSTWKSSTITNIATRTATGSTFADI